MAKLVKVDDLSVIKDNFLKAKNGELSSKLFPNYGIDFSKYYMSDMRHMLTFGFEKDIGYDTDADCLMIYTYSSVHSEREITINGTKNGGMWTNIRFNRNGSFPLNSYRSLASEEWISSLFVTKTDISNIFNGGG